MPGVSLLTAVTA